MTKRCIWFLLLVAAISCDYTQPNEIAQERPGREAVDSNQKFDQKLIASLYQQLAAKFEIDFSQKHLEIVFLDAEITDLKEGREISKELLFEDFSCNCLDQIKLSFEPENERFVLWVYEEFFEEDLDWCPESSYSYSFQIMNGEIRDLKLDFMAG